MVRAFGEADTLSTQLGLWSGVDDTVRTHGYRVVLGVEKRTE